MRWAAKRHMKEPRPRFPPKLQPKPRLRLPRSKRIRSLAAIACRTKAGRDAAGRLSLRFLRPWTGVFIRLLFFGSSGRLAQTSKPCSRPTSRSANLNFVVQSQRPELVAPKSSPAAFQHSNHTRPTKTETRVPKCVAGLKACPGAVQCPPLRRAFVRPHVLRRWGRTICLIALFIGLEKTGTETLQNCAARPPISGPRA